MPVGKAGAVGSGIGGYQLFEPAPIRGVMNIRPFFNTSSRDLEKLFNDSVSRCDTAALKALGDELSHRKTELARHLTLKVQEHLRDQGQETAPLIPNDALPPPASPLTEVGAGLRPTAPTSEVIDIQVAKTMTDPNIIDRLKGLLAYVVQTAKLKGTPPRTLEQHGSFKAYEHELMGLPGIEFDKGSAEDDIWLRVERLH